MIRNTTFFARFISRLSMVVAFLAVHAVVMAQTVTPPPPTGGGGGGNPDGPLDPLIPFDSTMNMVFLAIGVGFALFVMARRKKEQAAAKGA